MKKFLVTLVILLILGGTVFLFGWPQFSVPPGSYGIILSKTHGVDPIPVRSGEFRWLWYKLIPTNVKIAVFRLEPVSFSINYSSALPAGASYASFAGLRTADFSWDIKASVSFSINPEKLYEIVEVNNIADQDALDIYLQDISQKIEGVFLRNISALEADTNRLENILSGVQDDKINQEINSMFPQIEGLSILIQSVKFPDFTLYRQARSLFEEFLTRQREVIAAGFAGMAEGHIASQLYFEELRQYGELLTKYPPLLDYLMMENTRSKR